MKSILRPKLKRTRNALSLQFRNKSDVKICNFLQHITRNKIVGFYKAVGSEVNTEAIWFLSKQIALPALEGDDMVFRQYNTPDDLIEGKFTLQPKETKTEIIPQIVVLPLLGFDRTGGRIGYGKGFYDATLSQTKYRGCLKVGVGYSCQAVPLIDLDPHDVLLDMIVTEKECFKIILN